MLPLVVRHIARCCCTGLWQRKHCGAFTPVSWPSVLHGTDIGDRTGRTFLFSLSNLHGRAVKLRLKDGERANALRVRCGEVGPGFGAGADLRLMFDKAANLTGGCYTQPHSFEIDHEAERVAGLPPVQFKYNETLLSGVARTVGANSQRPTLVDRDSWSEFAAVEIEVYQMQ